jgi:hypothetical protein
MSGLDFGWIRLATD